MNSKFRNYVTSTAFNLSLSAPQIRLLSALFAQETQSVRWRLTSLVHGHGHEELSKMPLHILLERFRVMNTLATGAALEEKGVIESLVTEDEDRGVMVKRHHYRLTQAGRYVCVLLRESGQLVEFAQPGRVIERRA